MLVLNMILSSSLSLRALRLGAIASVASLQIIASAAVTDLRITEVNPTAGQVEVTNTAVTSFTATANLPFSHKLNEVSTIPVATTFAPGESRIFVVAGLDAGDSDLWLYKDSNFTEPGSIISGLKWGAAANVGRTGIAVAAGIWPAANAFVPAQNDPLKTIRLIAYDSRVPANWAEGDPNLLAFFGTGVQIEDPLTTITKSSTRIDLTPIATGLAAPVTVVQPDDNSNRLFICDQAGQIIIVKNGVQMATPLLDISSRLVNLGFYDERGLIGLAVHPGFATTPKIYTYSSEPATSDPISFPSTPVPGTYNHQGVVAEWSIDSNNPDLVDLSSRREILRFNEPQSNHNGGTLHFGPDGYFYISLGDGGAADDQGNGHLPDGNAQSLDNPLGKILRIQIDGGPFPNGHYGIPPDNPFIADPGLDEIWAYGMRNPYSYSFDSATGQLYLGGVGQNDVEEVNIVTAGANCGWRLKEGNFFFDPNGVENGFVTSIPVKPLPPNLTDPIAQYDHDDGISIIGGYVYHGSALPQLEGRYIFGDFGLSFSTPSGKLFFLNEQGEINQFTLGSLDHSLNRWIKGFGQDLDGEIYVCTSTTLGPNGDTGVVMKIVGKTDAAQWQLFR